MLGVESHSKETEIVILLSTELSEEVLAQWMTRFILEVRIQDSSQFLQGLHFLWIPKISEPDLVTTEYPIHVLG